MDCRTFNDCITEYEARRLSKKQEEEFLLHKDYCEECRLVFDLVFCEEVFEIDDYEMCFDNTVYSAVMDSINDIEHEGYNFKLYNILNIVFGVIVACVLFYVVSGFSHGHNSILSGGFNGISNVSKTFCSHIGIASNNIQHIYIKNILNIIIGCLAIGFIMTVIDYIIIKIRNKN